MLDVYNELFSQWKRDELIEEVQHKTNCGHYLPHRGVYRPTSKTTPVRPVYDTSCKIGQNKSLNECLYSGPNLLESLPAVILRFREMEKAFTADIRRAFQEIYVAEPDRDFLRFLWWSNFENNEICSF
jgi:hypothetical protein